MWFLLLATSACGSSPLSTTPSPQEREAFYRDRVSADACQELAASTLTRSQQLRDVDVLQRLFARGYAGWEQTASESEWSQAFHRLRASTPAQDTAARFRDRLVESLRFVDDNHVGFWYFAPDRRWRSTGSQLTPRMGPAVAPGAEAAPTCASVSEMPAAVRTEDLSLQPTYGAEGVQWRHVVLSEASEEPLRCSRGPSADVAEDAVTMEATAVQSDRGPAFEQVEAPFPWLRLRTLMTSHAGALERFVHSADSVRDAPLIVLDLRHTGGGSDRYLLRFFSRLTSQRLDYWHTDTLISETTLQGALNFWTCVRAAAAGSTDHEGQTWLDERVKQALRELEARLLTGPFREVAHRAEPVTVRSRERFQGRLVLVVDRGCASACETAVVLARQMPRALVVGENTAGTMKVGELRWYRLPESRVWVSLGHRAHGDPQSTFREGIGFVPDLWLRGPTGASIRQLAQCLQAPECLATLPLDSSR